MPRSSFLDPNLVTIWRFVRGDLAVVAFEQWAYEHADDVEAMLGKRLALDVLAADYRSAHAIAHIKEALRHYAVRASALSCACLTLADTTVVDMGPDGTHVMMSIEERQSRGEPQWWLWCGECTRCGQWWLVGQEERQNDVFCMSRLEATAVRDLLEKGEWPPIFDTYESLLRLGREAGRTVSFADSDGAASLRWTIHDLATARPGIRVSELAQLLALPVSTARRLAERAVRDDGVLIELDQE